MAQTTSEGRLLVSANPAEISERLQGPDVWASRRWLIDCVRARSIVLCLSSCSSEVACYGLIYACGQRRLRSSDVVVAKFLAHESESLRAIAAEALITVGSGRVSSQLRERLLAEADTGIRSSLILAIPACLAPAEAIAILCPLTRSSDALIRRCSELALKRVLA